MIVSLGAPSCAPARGPRQRRVLASAHAATLPAARKLEDATSLLKKSMSSATGFSVRIL
jgi:hypothetical protein